MSTVTFNVGGTFYTTIKETILKEPASRLSLIVRGVLPCVKDEQGVFFIDRDPKYFQLILNYLRDGWCLLPLSADERRELMQEIRYYQLTGFEAWVRTQELLGEKSDAIGGRSPLETMRFGDALPSYDSPLLHTTTRRSTSPRPVSPTRSMSPNPLTPRTPGRYSPPTYSPSPSGGEEGFKWTAKYLKTNDKLREVVNTLLELAYLPPHRSLHAGKVHISVTVDCDHDKIASLLGTSNEYLRSKYQVIRAKGAMGWSYEFTLRPSSDLALFDKYNISEYVQDNWFVLSAVLKDQYGIVLEEDISARPSCAACRRINLAISMQKYF